MTIDLDSSIVPVYGRGKQGAAFGYTKVRGYHPQFATCAATGMVLFSRLAGGSAGAARGAKSFLIETVSRVLWGRCDRTGSTVRADSACYSRAVLATAIKFNVAFSVTARQDKTGWWSVGSDPPLAASWRCSPTGTTTPSPTFGPGDVLQIEADHRCHSIVEQRIAELKSVGHAHLGLGKVPSHYGLARA